MSSDEATSMVQRRLLAALGLTQGAAPAAGDYIRVAEAAFEAGAVTGVRADDEPPLTGWQIEPAAPAAGLAEPVHGPHGQYQLRELLARRPPWLAALVLPAGWSFRCVGRELVEAAAPDGTRHRLAITLEAMP